MTADYIMLYLSFSTKGETGRKKMHNSHERIVKYTQ